MQNSHKNHKKQRRSLINIILWGGLSGVAASVIYPVTRFLFSVPKAGAETRSVTAGSVNELEPNSGKVIRLGTKPVMLIKTPDGEIRAFSAICTHLACIVQYREDFKHIWCACHNGHFDLNGRNVSGPPPRPLESFSVNIRGDEIIVSEKV